MDRRARLISRGSAENPAGRFERLALAEDAEFVDDDPEAGGDGGARPALRSRYYRDPSRTLLARNSSPDVPFDTSLNPYRGCENGCIYCLATETPVLGGDLVWRPIGELRAGDEVVGFDEEVPGPGIRRRLRRARVLAAWRSVRPTWRVITEHSEVVTTAEHRWLQARNFRWWRTDQLAPGCRLRRMPVYAREPIDDDYRVGYIAGMTQGDGTFRYQPGWRSDKRGFPPAYWRVALADFEPLERLALYLGHFGVDVLERPFAAGSERRRPVRKVETRSLAKLAILYKLVHGERGTRSYRRGFLAGVFDAEGSNSTSLRISQVDVAFLDRLIHYARSLGFELVLEPRIERASTVRLVGSVAERIRWFSALEPAIGRKRDAVFGTMARLPDEPVVAIERGPEREVVDIQTTTGTFYAAGLATHNCFARPTHEYLGLSPGLDFESHILVKADAPELLDATLRKPGWKPRTVAVGAVTDPYQPVERRLRITRRCLEVFARYRNPCGIVTKSGMVTRDLDVLRELAQWDCALVHVSITSLDDRLRRLMEPRASSPRERLRAVEALARAGVPVGVMVAPIVPGLTDHEIPALVQAAADAGARQVGRIVLRLPHGVADLFEAWLGRHFPERRQKVMNRVRALRGGRRNDPRFGTRLRGEGFFADSIEAIFEQARRRAGLIGEVPRLSAANFRRPGGEQLALLEPPGPGAG